MIIRIAHKTVVTVSCKDNEVSEVQHHLDRVGFFIDSSMSDGTGMTLIKASRDADEFSIHEDLSVIDTIKE